jgi:CheY-like chemotaxis protein
LRRTTSFIFLIATNTPLYSGFLKASEVSLIFEAKNMSATPGKRVLFVDDEPCMREIMGMMLNDEGYDVCTASDGLDALAQLRDMTPDLIISDLNMPRMSGLEFLSVVRRRFPSIPVIAISGAYQSTDECPAGVMADVFYPKSRCHPDELIRAASELIQNPVGRPTNYRLCHSGQVQTARVVRDQTGQPCLMLTCPDCLRGCSVAPVPEETHEPQGACCQFCLTPIHFVSEVSHQPIPQAALNAFQAARA